MQRVVTIIGPTGVGKSALALKLAGALKAEIISADSRQIYRSLDIGTAKATKAEQELVRHHLIDIVAPDEDFSLAQYQQMAYQAIDDINARHKLPLLVGGSGLYVWAVLEGWQIPKVAPDAALRRELEARAASGEAAQLYAELQQLDSEAAARIDPRNVRRVIRALEIGHQPQKNAPPSKVTPSFEQMVIGLTCPRDALYNRIDKRVDIMLQQGLTDEVRRLLERGYKADLPAMSGIGYRQMVAFLNGKVSQEEAVQQIKFESHGLARQQYNWFSLKNATIHWFNVTEDYYERAFVAVSEFINK
ncbi:MAG: tRNA (adenosine(37)-N6)-dimethylallyltransferase MiaA [Dehalococcoidia bacterium]|nr:tRNA (adenosine(37)-N6)-dimethylallyltransferase MiaA [Dehalococcoidia bacterium]MCL2615213.1 tRNA (adenosine(37)-N6)-dimethylallyltransferase MiaA [Dehalococcoidia bacterium]